MRIAIIGGGGLRTPLIVRGLLSAAHQGTLPVTAVALHDLDEARLDLIMAIVRDLTLDRAAPFEIEPVATLAEAVRGAAFVLSTVRVGGDAARVIDERVPLEWGVLGQETVGPGGFALALRTIPVLRECAESMRTLAPEAWLLCLTNPAGILTQALADAGFERVLGICDTPAALRRCLERVSGQEEDEVRFQYLGLNHLGWMQHLRLGERDYLEELLVRWDSLPAPLRRFPAASVRQMGILPGEYLYYYAHPDEVVGRVRAAGQTRAQVVADLNGDALRSLRAANAQGPGAARRAYEAYLSRREGSYFQIETGARDPAAGLELGQGYEETALSVLVGLYYGTGNAFVSMRNGTAIPGFAQDDVVEIQAELSAGGPAPIAVDEPRGPTADLALRVKQFERLTVAAAAGGSYRDAWEALASHPLVPSRSTAAKILDAYLRAHAALLPQFA
jgi:6-phospho-beta-glucosidase